MDLQATERVLELVKHDDADYGLLTKHRWYMQNGYIAADNPDGKGKGYPKIYMHRLIAGAQKGLVVDHINGCKTDNRRCNLRVCTHAENARNRHDRPSGITYVPTRGMWHAQITKDSKHIGLGYYKTPAEATAVYRIASAIMFGRYSPYFNDDFLTISTREGDNHGNLQ